MDELVNKYYRLLLRNDFENAGSLENPSIFLDTVGEQLRICTGDVHNYLHVYIMVNAGFIEDIKYLCLCDPAANVVVELLCTLVKSKTIEEARGLTEGSFMLLLNSHNEDFLKKADIIIELLNKGIDRYLSQVKVPNTN